MKKKKRKKKEKKKNWIERLFAFGRIVLSITDWPAPAIQKANFPEATLQLSIERLHYLKLNKIFMVCEFLYKLTLFLVLRLISWNFFYRFKLLISVALFDWRFGVCTIKNGGRKLEMEVLKEW